MIRTSSEDGGDADARRFRLVLSLIVGIGFVLRTAFVLVVQRNRLPLGADSFVYSETANLIVAGRGWIEPLFLPQVNPSADHPPLYIAWLAVASFIDPGSHTSQLTHMLWSCVPSAAAILLCGLAGREVAGPRAGLIAAALAAVYPNMWVWDGLLLSETIAIAAAAGVLLFAYRFWNRPTLLGAIWLGVWCGLAALARSELILVWPLILVPSVLRARDVSWAKRLRWLAVGSLCTVLVIAPWLGFNRARFREPVTFSTNFGRTLSAANCDATYFGPGIGFKSYGCIADALDRATRPGMDESEQDAALRKDAMEYVRAHATRVPVVVLARWGRILDVYHPTQELRANALDFVLPSWLAYSLIYTFLPLLAVALIGGAVLWRRRVSVWPLAALPVIILISVAVTFAQTRYRAPAEPALVILSAVGVDAGLQRLRRARQARPSRAN